MAAKPKIFFPHASPEKVAQLGWVGGDSCLEKRGGGACHCCSFVSSSAQFCISFKGVGGFLQVITGQKGGFLLQ